VGVRPWTSKRGSTQSQLGLAGITKVGASIPQGIITEKGSVTAGQSGYQTANITFQVDGRTLAKVLGAPLVDEIRVRTGMQI